MTRQHTRDLCGLVMAAMLLSAGNAVKGQKCVTTPPPVDAAVLFAGKDASTWMRRNRQPAEWTVEGDAIVATNNDIRTREVFGDHQLHVEFLIPAKASPSDRGNGNSGVYLHGFYELQVVENDSPKPHKSESCGALYGQAAPLVDASLPAGQWQSFDVSFQAPRFDWNNKPTRRARMSVWHNGILIHRDLEADPTPGSLDMNQFSARGPVILQYHGYPVRFRNIWVRRLRPVMEGPSEMDLVLPGGLRVAMIRTPAGRFVMGTPAGEVGREPDEQQHEVTISRGFWMGKFELTNAQYRTFRPDHVSRRKPDGPSNRGDHPVTGVDWNDASAFCKWASERTGWSVRLPTESEWEYAARAGTSTRYSFGDDAERLKEYAWYLDVNPDGPGHQSLAVGQLRRNPWGLYDVHGNVAEWCADWYGNYPGVGVIDPQGPPSGTQRVSREGSHGSHWGNCRAGDRDHLEPTFKCDALGFRIVCSSREDRMLVPLPGGDEIAFVRINPGTFKMGSPDSEPTREADEVPHPVTLTQGFWMGTYEVTNRQFRAFRPDHISGKDKSDPRNGNSYPVSCVDWDEATSFCRWASEKTRRAIRLPTEAEREYACRAGSTGRFSFGDDANELGKYAWYRTNVNGQTRAVGLLRPNAWGLFDMHGNVAEWCSDWYGPYPAGSVTDPAGPASGSQRVAREGSAASEHYNCRSADRDHIDPKYKGDGLGFRVVLAEQ